MNEPQSDTPITDESEYVFGGSKHVDSKVARTLERKLNEAKKELQEHDKEIGEFQNNVKILIDELADSNVDGAGCDSGDWRDFTLSEIGQGLGHVIDLHEETKKQLTASRELNQKLVELINTLPCLKYITNAPDCECASCVLKRTVRSQGFGKEEV